jgi:hypothetical protein
MVMTNFVNVASSVAIKDVFYDLSPDEQMLVQNGYIPQLNGAGSSLLGQGNTAKVYGVLDKNKHLAAKVSTNRNDITSIYKLYQIKQILKSNPKTADLAKHIMDVDKFFDIEVEEGGKKIKKHVAIIELLDNPPEEISKFFAYSNKIKPLPESQRQGQYRHTVEEMKSSITSHFKKARLAYSENSTGVFKHIEKFLTKTGDNFDKEQLMQASKEINAEVTDYLIRIETKTSSDIKSLIDAFKGTAIPVEDILKTKLLRPVQNEFINKPVPEFFDNIFYVESTTLVKKVIAILQRYNFEKISKDIKYLLEPLIAISLEIFLTGISISYKSAIETLDYFEHVEEVSSIIKLLKYLKDNNMVGFNDLHHYNIMVRDDGTIILSDPGSFVFFE